MKTRRLLRDVRTTVRLDPETMQTLCDRAKALGISPGHHAAGLVQLQTAQQFTLGALSELGQSLDRLVSELQALAHAAEVASSPELDLEEIARQAGSLLDPARVTLALCHAAAVTITTPIPPELAQDFAAARAVLEKLDRDRLAHSPPAFKAMVALIRSAGLVPPRSPL